MCPDLLDMHMLEGPLKAGQAQISCMSRMSCLLTVSARINSCADESRCTEHRGFNNACCADEHAGPESPQSLTMTLCVNQSAWSPALIAPGHESL